jgi:hypothetical protein
VAPTLSVCGDVIGLVVTGERQQERPWEENMAANREAWQARVGTGGGTGYRPPCRRTMVTLV